MVRLWSHCQVPAADGLTTVVDLILCKGWSIPAPRAPTLPCSPPQELHNGHFLLPTRSPADCSKASAWCCSHWWQPTTRPGPGSSPSSTPGSSPGKPACVSLLHAGPSGTQQRLCHYSPPGHCTLWRLQVEVTKALRRQWNKLPIRISQSNCFLGCHLSETVISLKRPNTLWMTTVGGDTPLLAKTPQPNCSITGATEALCSVSVQHQGFHIVWVAFQLHQLSTCARIPHSKYLNKSIMRGLI